MGVHVDVTDIGPSGETSIRVNWMTEEAEKVEMKMPKGAAVSLSWRVGDDHPDLLLDGRTVRAPWSVSLNFRHVTRLGKVGSTWAGITEDLETVLEPA